MCLVDDGFDALREVSLSRVPVVWDNGGSQSHRGRRCAVEMSEEWRFFSYERAVCFSHEGCFLAGVVV